MTITQMKYFTSVVKHKNISKAAKENYVSPTSISMMITDLEKRYRIKFIKKDGNTFLLTEEGEILYKKISNILEEYEKFENCIKNFHIKKQIINIGVSNYLVHITFQNFLLGLITKFPQYEFIIHEKHSSIICKKILEREYDIGFYFEMDEIVKYDKKIDFRLLKEEEVVCALDKNHKLAKNNFMELSELSELPLLFLEEKNKKLEQCHKGIVAIGDTLKHKYFSNSLSMLAELRANGGVALFLKNFISENENLNYLSIKPKQISKIKIGFSENNIKVLDIVDFIEENFQYLTNSVSNCK